MPFVNFIGTTVINFCNVLGNFTLFCTTTFSTLFTTKLKVKQVIVQMERIGVGSFSIIVLTGTSIGLALALQTYIGLSRFAAQDFIGVVVALGMTRELGPVMTALMITGRSGSSMAAELGTMKITEQIDALKTVCINPYQYLIVPRLIASILVVPLLTIFSMLFGMIGGYIYCIYVIACTPDSYMASIVAYVTLADIIGGLIKSSVFGLILALVGTYNGYYASGGARGVGKATTNSVVTGSIVILIANYFLSSLLFKTGIS